MTTNDDNWERYQQTSSYKRWERLLKEYGEQYSRTYQAEPGTRPHASETGVNSQLDEPYE